MTDDKLSHIPPLSRGAHASVADGACIMEAVAFVAGERWSDNPKCACPVLSTFLRTWNDALPDDERDILLRPLIPRLIGTRGSSALEHRRSLMAADWLVRVHTPAWLRLAGLTVHADALAALPEITDTAQIPSMRGPIAAAWAAARDAVWAAARDAARAAGDAAAAWAAAMDARAATSDTAAWAAAMDARAAGGAAAAWAAAMDARAAAWDAAAWSAAMDARAAGDAARAAARGKLSPTRMALQQSALALVNRMIAATA